MKNTIKVIGFDADDTLWVNEPFYQDVEKEFCQIMKPYMVGKETSEELFKTEMQNLEIYGYGAKGFILAMIESKHSVKSVLFSWESGFNFQSYSNMFGELW